MMKLPEEIITKILEFTCEPDKSNFENMASTCKLVRRISRGHQFTDYFKCQNCVAIKTALKNDHLTCYKWCFNEIAEQKIDQLCIDASKLGSLKAVKYLVSSGANIHAADDLAVRWESENGHLEVVKYLVSSGANIHADNDFAVRWASERGHSQVVQYPASLGENNI